MDANVVVHDGVDDAPSGSCLLHVWAAGGEDGDQDCEGRCERSACIFDREGDKLHPSPMFLEGRDEGECFSVLLAPGLRLPRIPGSEGTRDCRGIAGSSPTSSW